MWAPTKTEDIMIFTIENINNGTIKIIMGYNFIDACNKAGLIHTLWNILEVDFIYD